ncbi:MAG: hypothetical protein J0H78_13715 [Rhizobiales bacterium]|nr:hypothetical protein [Hyphomicrobiales bacterium]
MHRFGLATGCFSLIVLSALCLPLALRAASAQPTHPPAQSKPDVFDDIGDWFSRQWSNFQRDTRRSVDVAKDAADGVAKFSEQRTVRGHEVCGVAPNGAPDCQTAAVRLCRGAGYASGKSIDSTTAENCPAARMLLTGPAREAAGQCRTETFISRALCTP